MRSALFALAAGCLVPICASAAELAVGQTRACQSGPEKQLYVTVGAIDYYGEGRAAVSVSIFNKAPNARYPRIAHAPLDADTLTASCPTVVDQPIALAPGYEHAYQRWRADPVSAFTLSIEQIYDIVVEQVSKAHQGGPNAP